MNVQLAGKSLREQCRHLDENHDIVTGLFDRLEEANVKGKKVAVFGCGESDRIWFCGAVDAIEKKLKELDADVVNTLRIDGDPKEKKSVINDWANRVAANMIRTKH